MRASTLIFTLAFSTIAFPLCAQNSGRFTLVRSAISSGGAVAQSSGQFSVSNTIGQPIAGLTIGTRFSAQNGYWITPTFLIFAPAKVGGAFNLSFETTPGRSYIIEYTDSLLHPNWIPLPTVTGDGTVKSISDTTSVSNRYYRIREP